MSKYILFYLFIFSSILGYSQTASVSGVISTHSGTLIPNVAVTLKADNFEQVVMTDATGNYLFSDIPTDAIYTIEMILEGAPLNGAVSYTHLTLPTIYSV